VLSALATQSVQEESRAGWVSDTRAATRRLFHMDTHSMVVWALQILARRRSDRRCGAGKSAERYQLHDVGTGSTGTLGES
jgi:pyruvate dehydrogenase E1 component